MFIHDALSEYITCGETEITASNMRAKFNHLSKTIPGKGVTGFANQFQVSFHGIRRCGHEGVICSSLSVQLLEQVSRKPEEEDCSDAVEHFNRNKNRYPDRLPCMW